MTVRRVKSHFTGSGPVVLKADTKMVVQQPLDVEDEFRGLYESTGQANNNILEPPFNPSTLVALCYRNNVLQQCIHAMEVNVDGTGHTIELHEGEGFVENEIEKKRAEDFFKEPYPGMSMISIRRKLRVDLEQTGNAFMEVLRNPNGELLGLRYIPATTVRLVRLDDSFVADKIFVRDGKEVTVKMMVRERRYVQRVGQKKFFYKEFGSTRELDRETGEWSDGKKKLEPKKQASELLWFGIDRDSSTPYYIPRWINNLPSILGSRKAEEFNLEFFDAGGLPPAVVFVVGGALTTSVREQLQNHLNGRLRNKHRASVVEVQTAGVDIKGGDNKVDVKVERFGDARQGDSMFQNYDTRSEDHTRVAFRLPPLFLGKASDYNFATAVTAYMVAEEQVFAPERKEFDEVLNNTIMKELGVKNYKFVSKPITLKNADLMLQAVQLGAEYVDGEEFLKQVNMISGLNMAYSKEAEQRKLDASDPFKLAEAQAKANGVPPQNGEVLPGKGNGSGGNPFMKRPEGGTGKPDSAAGAEVKKTSKELATLVVKWSEAMGFEPSTLSPTEKLMVMSAVRKLSSEDREAFNALLAAKSFVSLSSDPEGLTALAGGCAEIMSRGE